MAFMFEAMMVLYAMLYIPSTAYWLAVIEKSNQPSMSLTSGLTRIVKVLEPLHSELANGGGGVDLQPAFALSGWLIGGIIRA